MATVSIRGNSDISKARNNVHKLLLAQRCSPNLAARSVTAVKILTESLSHLGLGISLSVGVVLRDERRIVEFACDLNLTSKPEIEVAEMQELLPLVVNDLQ